MSACAYASSLKCLHPAAGYLGRLCGRFVKAFGSAAARSASAKSPAGHRRRSSPVTPAAINPKISAPAPVPDAGGSGVQNFQLSSGGDGTVRSGGVQGFQDVMQAEVPREFGKNLRACVCCRLVKTYDQARGGLTQRLTSIQPALRAPEATCSSVCGLAEPFAPLSMRSTFRLVCHGGRPAACLHYCIVSDRFH